MALEEPTEENGLWLCLCRRCLRKRSVGRAPVWCYGRGPDKCDDCGRVLWFRTIEFFGHW